MSKALKDMHEAARDLFEVGAMDAITMKAMDELCLPSMREFSQEEVKSVRRKAKMSQPVFAVLLGVTSSAVAQWRGAKASGHH